MHSRFRPHRRPRPAANKHRNRVPVAQVQPTVGDAVQAAPLELAQRRAGVHQRRAQAVGDVLLRKRKGDPAGARVGLQRACALDCPLVAPVPTAVLSPTIRRLSFASFGVC
jgi:hypothetical protein